MPSMKDPLVKEVHDLMERSSIPEVVESLVTIAGYYKRRLKRDKNREYVGWEIVEAALAKAAKEVD